LNSLKADRCKFADSLLPTKFMEIQSVGIG